MSRILHKIDVFHTGGIAELILNFHKYDRQNTHDVWCYEGSLAPEARSAGLTIWQGGPPPQLLQDHYYDILIGHTVGGWSYQDTFEWARQYGMKTIELMHSNAISPTPPELVDVFVGVNKKTTSLNRQMNKRAQIYPMVPPGLFDIFPGLGLCIGKLSRMVEEKSPREFVQKSHVFPNEAFILAGDGNLRREIEPQCPPNLTLFGTVRDFVEFYSRLKLFVFPTKDECASVAVAMAQAAGVPVICQDLSALRESTGGFAQFANTHEDFIRLIDDFLRVDHSISSPYTVQVSRAQDWVQSNFHPNVVIGQYNQLFSDLLKG